MAQRNVAVDESLLQQAQEALGGRSESETVEVALMEVLRMKRPAEAHEEAAFEVRERPADSGERPSRGDLPVYSDLDWLVGSWSEEEAREFAEATAELDRIEPGPWR
jgi:Arc/MetJ family transcription regulator